MFPNYKELYPTSAIPMGENDRNAFIQNLSENKKTLFSATHWVIALEGSPTDHASELYYWTVKVYPSNNENIFYYEYPHLASLPLYSFHDAELLAKEIELQIKTDELFTEKKPLLRFI
ncbi:hypothetical protein [Anoxybacteroides rupiense]|uniref:hypothetical protein n=1 Tax=Anoxybacteroides rupiense TaxID=311460 RepID=UPI0016059693|nr:hypothetical protein [Anoxybacillus rupiensis]MBB3905826.1 hypothetical protein [Anoxybacillus rupiensis]